ncbi:MAG: DUF2283 domain-containing protein [Chloroflexi bacterium]|nr:DUF2283 domain-containing protein [Chloroflexota bacterium]
MAERAVLFTVPDKDGIPVTMTVGAWRRGIDMETRGDGRQGFHLAYDYETDILHMALGAARSAISIEQEADVFLRVDPDTHELVGLTILNFSRSFLQQRQKLDVPLRIAAYA